MTKAKDKGVKTRAHIVAVARVIFARNGYSKTALNTIVSEAGVTTGAIYHHFTDKRGLFRAVAESVEQQILDELVIYLRDLEPGWDAFERGVEHTLEICSRPDIQRIVFRDAPSVFGQREWREIEIGYSLGLLTQSIENLIQTKEIATRNSDMTAQIILGAIIEAAHSVAASKRKSSALAEAKRTIVLMLGMLKVP